MVQAEITLRRGRLLVLAAALMWSTSGMLGKLIALPGPTMACYRALFATLTLLPFLNRRTIRFRPAMLGMIACFATMNICYVTSITLTTAANAIFLQYTAPGWMFLASVFLLREPMDRRSLIGLLIGLAGVTTIVAGSWHDTALGVALGLASGITYGGVAVFLRVLRDEDPYWLTVLNHLVSGLVLLPVVLRDFDSNALAITAWQWVGLAVYGAAQMAIPYTFFSRGLSVVTPQEAGLITLLEPVVNTFLTWLAVGEVPSASTMIGGTIILAGVSSRYLGGSSAPGKAHDANGERPATPSQ
jgi:DME family drug/metabolite transporter